MVLWFYGLNHQPSGQARKLLILHSLNGLIFHRKYQYSSICCDFFFSVLLWKQNLEIFWNEKKWNFSHPIILNGKGNYSAHSCPSCITLVLFCEIKTIPNLSNYKMWTVTKIWIVVLVENLETTLTQISKMIGLALEDMNQVTDSDERYFFSLGVVFLFCMDQ